ncbi:MAG: hypothetical protein N2D54_01870 [Chloroflexota bacterium]
MKSTNGGNWGGRPPQEKHLRNRMPVLKTLWFPILPTPTPTPNHDIIERMFQVCTP